MVRASRRCRGMNAAVHTSQGTEVDLVIPSTRIRVSLVRMGAGSIAQPLTVFTDLRWRNIFFLAYGLKDLFFLFLGVIRIDFPMNSFNVAR